MTPPSDKNASATEAAPRRRRKEARPQELMAAALALFVEHGFAATRLDDVIVPGRRLLALTLERGMAAGEFRGVDVDTAIDVVIAPLLMLAIWRYSMGPCCPSDASYDTERYLRTHLDIALDGLRCRG